MHNTPSSTSTTHMITAAPNPVLELKNYMMRDSDTSGNYLCMNLSAAEIKGLGWPPISPTIKSEETCNYQHNQITDVVKQVHIRQSVDINYYENPKTIRNVVIHNIVPSDDSSVDSLVAQEKYDVIRVDNTRAIRYISEKIAGSFMKIGSTSKYITCSLYARIPTGLVQIIHNYEFQSPYPPINLITDTEPACQQITHVLQILLENHSDPDASSPTFCLDINPLWLREHQLRYSDDNDGAHEGSGCQDQALTWNYLTGTAQQNVENDISVQIVHGIYSANSFRKIVLGGRDVQIWDSSFEGMDINSARSTIIHCPITEKLMLIVKVNSPELTSKQVSSLAKAIAFYELSRNIPY